LHPKKKSAIFFHTGPPILRQKATKLFIFSLQVHLFSDRKATSEARFEFKTHENGLEITKKKEVYFIDCTSKSKLQAWCNALEDNVEIKKAMAEYYKGGNIS
jgi:hypothetical protein